jgi:hypothetical protein
MPVAAATLSTSSTTNMDDRKRVAVDDPASTPPLKKQATKHVQSNGTSVHPDHDMPWKDDIERYQK